MKTINVGVKYPELGTPLSVEGMEVRPLVVAVGEGEAVWLAGVAVGVGEGVAKPEGVAMIDGSSLVPAAKTKKV